MSERVNIDDLVGIFHTAGPSMCSVCLVREQRDGDEFVPCSPECYQAALRACEQQVVSRMGGECTRREQHGFDDGFGRGAAAMKRAARAAAASMACMTGRGSQRAARHADDVKDDILRAITAATVEPK